MNDTSLGGHPAASEPPGDCRSIQRVIPLLQPGRGAGIRVAQIMRSNGATYREIASSLHVSMQYVERVLAEKP